MNKELLNEIIRIKQLAGIQESNRVILLENGGGRAGMTTVITKYILGIGREFSQEAIEKRAKVFSNLLNDNSLASKWGTTMKQEGKETAIKKVIQDLEAIIQKGGDNAMDEVLDLLEKKFGKDSISPLINRLTDFVDDEIAQKLKAEILDKTSEISDIITKNLDDEVAQLKKTPEFQKADKTLKLGFLRAMKERFQKEVESVLGLTKEGVETVGQKNAISELLEKALKETRDEIGEKVALNAFQSFAQYFSKNLSSLPGFWGQFANTINTIIIGLTKNAEQLKKEIDDITASIATKKYDVSETILLISRMKVLITMTDDISQSFAQKYDDLVKQLRDAIEDTDLQKQFDDILGVKDGDLYKRWNNLYDFFNNIKKSDNTLGGVITDATTKIGEMLTTLNLFKFLNPANWTGAGASGIVKQVSDGLLRTTNLLVQGTLSTFTEFTKWMASKRNFLGIGKEISGFGAKSTIDMYVRIWFISKIVAPVTIGLIFSIGALFAGCLTQGLAYLIGQIPADALEGFKEYESKWCGGGGLKIFWDYVKPSLNDTFSPIIELLTASYADTELNNASVLDLVYEVFEMVQPFTSTFDDFISLWLTGNKDPEKSVDDAANEKTKDEEDKIKDEIDPKKLAKKEEKKLFYKTVINGYSLEDKEYESVYSQMQDSLIIDTLDKNAENPILMWKGTPYTIRRTKNDILFSDAEGRELLPKEFVRQIATLKESIRKIIKKLIMEDRSGKKFGDYTIKHWADTFDFYTYDEETNEYKELKSWKSKMEDIMDVLPQYQKTYDEDDAFVRAVIKVFGDKIDQVRFNKGTANLRESVLITGLMKVLSNIREEKTLEIWSVKYHSDGNWELVKGSFNKKELQNVGKTVRDREKEQEERKKPLDGLKKKEDEAINLLKTNEDEGLNLLPVKIKEKVKEKIMRGWTTETPPDFLIDFYTTSEINSIFSDKIQIYKVQQNKNFVESLIQNSPKINLKRGFCKTLKVVKDETSLTDKEEKIINHLLEKCQTKFFNKVKKFKPSFND